jgi:hypothetical protein
MQEINQQERQRPKVYIDIAVDLFLKNNGRCIVEIGGMRQMLTHDVNDTSFPCCNDGHSSVLWAHTGADFYSVEKDEGSARITAACCLPYPNAKIMHMDGIDFLNKLETDFQIDLLYLDAWDVNVPECAEKHLEAFITALPHLHKKSIVLIDDTDVDFMDGVLVRQQGVYAGKGKLLIPEALENGWKVLYGGRQTLLCQQLI